MKIKTTTIFLILMLLTCSKIFADTHYVSLSGGHVSPFTSWTDAATNIQAAVDVAFYGDTVLVTNGIYDNGETAIPKRSSYNRVVITADITVKSVNGPENTIILGKGPLGDGAVRGVYMSAGVLDGFTVSNGYTMASSFYTLNLSGGGVNMTSGGMITNCTITGNSARYGGGTYRGSVNNCTITGNSAVFYGGGTYEGTLNNCTICGNSAVNNGGGTYDSTVNNCTISRNSANVGGGTYKSIVNNCTIIENSAGDEGGGTYKGTVNNCTISRNSAINYGGGTDGGTVNNCIVRDNSASTYSNIYNGTISYSCSYPLPPGTGNFTNDPILLSESHISPFSPCIGAGTNAYATGTDIDGELWTDPPSVGCDEVYLTNLTGDLIVNIYTKYTSAVVGTTIEFSAIIVGKPASNHWSFSDGYSSADKYIINHSFSATGEYQVLLTAFNSDNPAGISATITVNVVELNDATYYVNKANTTPVYPYNSWSTAASNIQDAVDVALQTKKALVLITNGIYDTGGNVTPGYSCSNRVVITGDIIVKSVNGPKNTIILGKGPLGSNAVRGVYMSAGILEGFTISNGHTMISGNWHYDTRGGGVNMYCGNGIVINCVISGNLAGDGSGTCDGTVYNCTINGNSAVLSGGGTCDGTVYNCTISGNSAEYGGGTCDGTVYNCTINGNSAVLSGGGTSGGTINNSTISGNSAREDGGGTSYGTVNNCSISGNSAVGNGGGSYQSTANNCIVYYNSANSYSNRYSGTYNYCCTTPDGTNGTGNISTEPMFVSASHIATNSPCIGAGSTNYISGVDIDGEAWKNPPSIGCDEIYANAISGSLSVAIVTDKIFAYPDMIFDFRAEIHGKLYRSIWDLGDGRIETNKTEVSHSWSSLGDYEVILTAFNDTYPAGVSDTVTVHVVTNIHYVNINNPTPVPPYSSWSTAAINIQDAVDISHNGGKIFVTNGIYILSSQVDIDKSLAIQSINGPENTIVNGNNSIRCFNLYGYNTVISGFTITNGRVGNSNGGGVYCSDKTPLIINCIISENSADYGGGTHRGTVNNCTITGNSASGDGGGNFGSTLNNSTISGNSAVNDGGGISGSTVNNCTISRNSARDNGGGVSGSTVNNCTISGNSARGNGGGVRGSTVNNCSISGNSSDRNGGGAYEGTVNNCTISGNLAILSGGGSYYSTVNNCIVWDNSAYTYPNIYNGTIRYSCSFPLPTGVGNFTNNPVLLSASHISPSSPCIGAGTNVYATGTDIDGETWNNPPSVGCDEVYLTNLTGDLIVNIYTEYTSAVVGTDVKFSAIIVGKPASNHWSFSDGYSSADKHFINHSFSATGEYEVILTAYNNDNPAGVSATITVNIVELNAATYYVNKANTTPMYPYNSWTTAASNIQGAVDAASQIRVKGSLVLVTNGIYDTGETVTPGYSCSNRVMITGDIIVKSVNGPKNTVVLGKGPLGDSAVRGVYMSAGILDGFTISNGHTMINGDYYYDRNGGGVNMFGGNGIVTNCTISWNLAHYDGGGVYYGTVNNCTISGNSAGDNGGGTYDGTINNSTISGNSAGDNGGGTCYGTFNNCTISGNSAGDNGGGTYQSTVNNCTISGNSAADSGGGTYNGTANNCIVYYNSANSYSNRYSGTYNYCCTTPDGLNGTGNISEEPILVSASHIATNSPCIGAGSTNYISGADIDGEAWKNPPSIGCDEVYANAISGSLFVTIVANKMFAYPDMPFDFRTEIHGKLYRSIWDLGDGKIETNKPNVSHSWSSLGGYEVILTAFNDTYPAGVSDTVTVHVVTNIHYVNINNPTPVSPYSSWSTAAINIQDAVDIAYNSGIIFVTNGIYDTGETVTPESFCSNRVVITTDITVKSVNGPENTIILGKGPLGDDAVRGVYMTAGVLDGFTISNGHTMTSERLPYNQCGGGVNMYGGNGIVTNCSLIGNSAYSGGGSFYGSVNNCTISGNSSDRNGGGTYQSTLNNCTISENSARGKGGGNSGSTLNNCSISGNSSDRNGGGNSGSTLNNCVISGNLAGHLGGGTYWSTVNNSIISGNSAITYEGGGTFDGRIYNCTITGNSAGNEGGGTCSSTLNNCIVWDNTATTNSNFYNSTISYSCSYPLPSGTGNISNNPQFVSVSDFHLLETSPCIDAGTNAYVPMPWDLDGNPRIIDGTVDMGAYEFVPEPVGIWIIGLLELWIIVKRSPRVCRGIK